MVQAISGAARGALELDWCARTGNPEAHMTAHGVVRFMYAIIVGKAFIRRRTCAGTLSGRADKAVCILYRLHTFAPSGVLSNW